MRIYTFQPKDVLEEVLRDGRSYVNFKKTNLFHKMNRGADISYAYLWMAKKLSEKTGIWYSDAHGDPDDAYRESFGEMAFESDSMPVLPYWGWYIVNGKNEKPGPDYNFGNDPTSIINWNQNGNTALIGLDIPEDLVLLSDANAWYCVLQGIPCYEYEDEVTEARLLEQFKKKLDHIKKLVREEDVSQEMFALFCEVEKTWDNIFRVTGRRLRPIFPIGMEVHDVQAVFPYIDKEWIIDM